MLAGLASSTWESGTTGLPRRRLTSGAAEFGSLATLGLPGHRESPGLRRAMAFGSRNLEAIAPCAQRSSRDAGSFAKEASALKTKWSGIEPQFQPPD
jgi:hypothetical protein